MDHVDKAAVTGRSSPGHAIDDRLGALENLARALHGQTTIEAVASLCLRAVCDAGPWSSGRFDMARRDPEKASQQSLSVQHPAGAGHFTCNDAVSGPSVSYPVGNDGVASLRFYRDGSVPTDPLSESLVAVAATLLGFVIERRRLTEDRAFADAERARKWALLKQSEDAMRERHAHLHTAINNMSQGLAMYDGDGKLVLCNDLYATMYGLTSADVRPGTTPREIADRRRAKGFEIADLVEDGAFETYGALALKNESRTWPLGDGRRVLVSVQPLWNGGWVTTHEDTTERERFEERISHLAHHDALTDLANRVLFRERLDLALANTARDGVGFALLWLDLDRFKIVNDTTGHIMGDLVLKTVANRIRAGVRESDLVARLGGDEFAILQVPARSVAEVDKFARRIREIISAPLQIEGQRITLDASVGICMAPDDTRDANQMLLNADIALYRAKAEGRCTHRFFQPGMGAAIQTRRQLELALHEALDDESFELHYQPIVDLNTGLIVSCEALLRWYHPDLGTVSPSDFIPVAEEAGLMVRLGRWVLARACMDAAGWPTRASVAVNISPAHVVSQELTADVVRALEASGLRPERLEVEITETVLMQHTDAALCVLNDLRARGMKLALDDFGTGYSSLAYLGRFPFSKIKIDRSFIAGLPDERSSHAIVKAITGLSDGLGVSTTAEGVETERQLAAVLSLGCNQVQGFLFSRPMNNETLLRLLARDREHPLFDAIMQEHRRDTVNGERALGAGGAGVPYSSDRVRQAEFAAGRA